MEIAKNIAQWRDQPAEQWLARVNQILPPVVIAVIVVLVAMQAVSLLWVLLDRPGDQDLIPPAVPGESAQESSGTAWSLNSAYGLFGAAPVIDESVISRSEIDNAPETDLNLTLNGLLVAQELPELGSSVVAEAGAAIIGVGREPQQSYWTGDKIEGVGNVSLYLVFEDRVLLDRGGGRYETLYFDDDALGSQALQMNSRLNQRTTETRAAPLEPVAAVSAAEELSGLAATLGQHMSMQPQSEGGRIIGMRLQPGGDGRIYSELGFEPGDVLLEVNGLRVDNLRNIQAVSQALAETDQASVRILRNEDEQVLSINLSDIQQLTQSLQ